MATVAFPWVQRFRTPGVLFFATIDAIDAMGRALLVTVIPIQALDAFGDSRDISLAFTFGGVAGLAGLFTIPWLIRTFRRRFVYTLGVALLIAAAAALATASQVGVVVAIVLRTFATSCVIISMNLYVMEFIHKRDFGRLEPIRIMAVGVPWTVGPYLGVHLYAEVDPLFAYAIAAACAALVLAYFWWVPLRGQPTAALHRAPRAPWRDIGRFIVQPRLRLAWLLAFGRSCWWSMFFIYVPLFMVESGLGELAGALAVSIGNATLLMAPVFGWLARRFHMRPVITVAFLALAGTTLAAGLTADAPYVAASLLLLGTLPAVALDGLAIILFYRAVHPYERPEMSAVYSTWRDLSNMATPGIAAIALSFGPLPWVFVALGATMFVYAAYSRYIPHSM